MHYSRCICTRVQQRVDVVRKVTLAANKPIYKDKQIKDVIHNKHKAIVTENNAG